MTEPFEIDPYPGKPKILFIGLGASTNTQGWIDLLSEAELNVRLFSVPGGDIPPFDWKTRTYICSPSSQLPDDLDLITRQSFHPLPQFVKLHEEEIKLIGDELNKRKIALEGNVLFLFSVLGKDIINFFGKRLGMPYLYHVYSQYRDLKMPNLDTPEVGDPEEWLAKIIREWQPDIIHTLGLFDGQGGLFYFEARERFGLKELGKWVLQLRGGSDLTLRRHNPEDAGQILKIFAACDEIITDNDIDIDYLKQLGLANKIASIAPVPGTGGINVNTNIQNLDLPSTRQRLIFWPNAYESPWSKALPVIEALKLAWGQIKPCTIFITATDNETMSWLNGLPEEIKKNCNIQRRIPRDQVLEVMKRARVMLAPSLVDGVPNVLYEAMANGAFPIVSPLETITPIVSEPQNTLFARNLYPREIADAIAKGMIDHQLVDVAAKNNLQLVGKLESRSQISKKAVDYYFSQFKYDKLDQDSALISVIIPFFNRIPWVIDAVKSVLNQTYQNFEINLVDDGSTESLDSLTELKDARIRILHQNNSGPAAARNHGMRAAKGEYIAFLDSDDLFEPTKLMYQLKMLVDHPDIWFSHTSYRYFGGDGHDEVMHSGRFSGSVYPHIFAGCPIAPSTVMFNREVVDRNIFMEERYKISEDIIFFSKIARFSEIVGIDIPLTRFRKTQSTHASSTQAQIIGSQNILHFLRNSNQDMPSSQRRAVLLRIYEYIGENYKLQERPFLSLYYYGLAFLVKIMFPLWRVPLHIRKTSETLQKT